MMDTNLTKIDLGDLSKPINTLINKISDAIGTLYKPLDIKRIAKAEAEAEKTKTQSLIETEKMYATAEIEIKEIQARALNRFLHEETRKQINIEQITAKSFKDIKEDAKPENIEDDWIVNFFDKSKLVSDEQLQGLWAKILAGEANSPGSYSKRTINFVSSLDKYDAESFEILCSFSWMFQVPNILIYDVNHKIYKDNGLNFNKLVHLSDIGLTNHYPIGYVKKRLNRIEYTSYFNTPIEVHFQNDQDNEIGIGTVLLSRIGVELKKIINPKPIPDFIDYIIQHWFNENVYCSSPYPKCEVPIDVPYSIVN